jgi:hypothetical protein
MHLNLMIHCHFQFFRPIEPVNVRIILENGGRPSGEADVEFATHEEAVKAMCKVRTISLRFLKFNKMYFKFILSF